MNGTWVMLRKGRAFQQHIEIAQIVAMVGVEGDHRVVRKPEVLKCCRQVADRVVDTGDHAGRQRHRFL